MTQHEPPHTALSMRPIQGAADLKRCRDRVDVLTFPDQPGARFITGIASSEAAIEEALRLRYQVFNLELGEGLDASTASGIDRDRFDDQMVHLLLIERESNAVIGIYRMQTLTHAMASVHGPYSAQEYDLCPLEPLFPELLELGRACIAQPYRSIKAVLAIWTGIGSYMNLYEQRYLFGCCSLTSTDPDDGWRAMKTIRSQGFLHPDLWLTALGSYGCGDAGRETASELGDALRLPKLFRAYMHLGAQVISEPAIDRAFGTVDFLILMDGTQVSLSSLDVLE